MGRGYCLKWTIWRILFHPFKARKDIEEANGMQEDLSRRLAEALDMLEKQRKECARITMDNVEMSRRLSDCEFELSRTRSELTNVKRKLEEAQDRLAEHKSVDEKIAEFNKELSKAENMKHTYEKRIAELESRLGDAKSRLSRADDRELIDSIDMTAPAIPSRYRRPGLHTPSPAHNGAAQPRRAAKPIITSAKPINSANTATTLPGDEVNSAGNMPGTASTRKDSGENPVRKGFETNPTGYGSSQFASRMDLQRKPKTSSSEDNDWLMAPPDF